MRTAFTAMSVAFFAGAAVAGSGPIKLQADRLDVQPGTCGSTTYVGSAAMEVAGAEVNGVRQTPQAPGAGTLFRADLIRLIRAAGPQGCAAIERVELEGNVSYRTPSKEAAGYKSMIYYPETDTMTAVGPEGGVITVKRLQPEATPAN